MGSGMAKREYAVAACAFAALFVALFSPVLSAQLLLGPGDGAQYWTFFQRGFLLWNERILSGFPAFADPQQLTWYPLRWLAPGFNAFVVAAYVVAATGGYALARVYRARPEAAVAAGIAYACSGFMIAHLGHTTIIHAAAWLPWIIAAIEKCAEGRSHGWRAIGALAIGLALLAGHPQVVIYGLGVGVILMAVNVIVLARQGQERARPVAFTYAAMIAIGGALAAIQLVPTFELAGQTERAAPTFEFFVTYSLPIKQLATFFFPFSWGPWAGAGTPYFGDWNFVELANFAGLSTLVFIAAGFGRIADAKKYVWLAAAIGAFLFSLGSATPVARLAFELPVVQSFRVPGRAAVVLALASSVLLGMALSALAEARGDRRQSSLFGIAPVIAALIAAFVFLPISAAAAAAANLPPFDLTHQTYLVPLLAGVAAVGVVAFVAQQRAFAVAACTLLAAELSWWAVNVEWRWWSPPVPTLSADVAALRDRAHVVDGRIAPIEGVLKGPSALHPNISSVFGIASTAGYGPLLPNRYGAVASISTSGEASLGNLNAAIFQSLGVSHVVYAPSQSREMAFSRGCGGHSPSGYVVLPSPVKATHIRIRSHMGCAPQVPQGTQVLEIRSGGSRAGLAVLRAGVDTAEWAIRRPDVAPIAQHREPTASLELPNSGGMGRIYDADIPLLADGEPIIVNRLDFDLQVDSVSLRVFAIDLVDAATGVVTPVTPTFPPGLDPEQFIADGAVADLVSARFTGFIGRYWLAPQGIDATAEQSLAALRSQRSPDGSPLDLRQSVLIEGEAPNLGATSPGGTVRTLMRSDGLLRVETDTPTAQFLVISQQFHPGWRAFVNGSPVPIYRANHAFQAVVAPAGRNVIELRFEPRSLAHGGGITAIAALSLMALTFGGAAWRRWIRVRKLERHAP